MALLRNYALLVGLLRSIGVCSEGNQSYYKPQVDNFTGNHDAVIEYHTLIVTPHVDVNPDNYTTVWTRDGEILSRERTLSIETIKRDDAGEYSLTVANFLGTITKSFNVTVHYGPSVNITETADAIVCTATSGIPKKVVFSYFEHYAEGTLIRDIQFDEENEAASNTHKMPFDKTAYDSTGTYRCSVKNEVGGKRIGGSSATLTVKTNYTPVIVGPPNDFTICTGETRDISVKFYSASGYTKILWIHNDNGDEKNVSNKNFIVRKTQLSLPFHRVKVLANAHETVLLLSDAAKNKAGTYILRVSNSNGTTKVAVRVQYDSAPRQPMTLGNMEFCSLKNHRDCFACEPGGLAPCHTPVRRIGDKIKVSCSKEVAFPPGSLIPNTFRWFISGWNGNAAWQDVTRIEQVTGSKPTYDRPHKSTKSGPCYPTNIKTSTLTFAATGKYLKQLKISCVVAYKFGDSQSYRYRNTSICLIGGLDNGSTVSLPTTPKLKASRLLSADNEIPDTQLTLGMGIGVPLTFLMGFVITATVAAYVVRKKYVVRIRPKSEYKKLVSGKNITDNAGEVIALSGRGKTPELQSGADRGEPEGGAAYGPDDAPRDDYQAGPTDTCDDVADGPFEACQDDCQPRPTDACNDVVDEMAGGGDKR